MIDPTFRNIVNGDGDPIINSFDEYYMALVETKMFNSLIGNILFFDQAVNRQQAYEKLVEMSRNNDYITQNLLDYMYHQSCYELIGIDISRQTNTTISQQINFTGKLEEGDGATIFFITEKQQKSFQKKTKQKKNGLQ